jgi:hypothetical protein
MSPINVQYMIPTRTRTCPLPQHLTEIVLAEFQPGCLNEAEREGAHRDLAPAGS